MELLLRNKLWMLCETRRLYSLPAAALKPQDFVRQNSVKTCDKKGLARLTKPTAYAQTHDPHCKPSDEDREEGREMARLGLHWLRGRHGEGTEGLNKAHRTDWG